jgi:hypothetical protein
MLGLFMVLTISRNPTVAVVALRPISSSKMEVRTLLPLVDFQDTDTGCEFKVVGELTVSFPCVDERDMGIDGDFPHQV